MMQSGYLPITAAWLVDQHSPQTTLPIGWLIIWLICARRKDQPIGGWLAYYYYQLYLGVAVSALLVLGVNLHSYIPETFAGETERYLLFIASALPSLLVLCFQASVATFALISRTWDLIELLRKVLLAQVLAETCGILIDLKYFPDNISLGLLSFVPAVLWLGYFYKSTRVVRVFKTHDWDSAFQAAKAAAIS